MFSGNLKDKRNEKSRNLDIFIRRNLNVDFLQEGMIRITIFFASFTCLCKYNQDPAQELWNRKSWISWTG